MSMERLKTVAGQILTRVPMVRGKGEEVTKQALILPMIDALGYDIWNPSEVCPEYEADFATKKLGQKEKVDYAIFLDGMPRAYIEAKAMDVPLDGHEGQLARYFNATPSVSLAILSNGLEYRFFTDTGDPNIMDTTPFHTVKLDGVDQGLEIMARFHKSVFSPDAIRDFATELNYTLKISTFLRAQLDLGEREPSEAFVRWVLSEEKSYTGRLTANVVERFQSIIKEALQIVLRDIVRRSVAALDKEVKSPSPATPTPPPPQVAAPIQPKSDVEQADASAEDRSKIVTSENELALFALVKKIFDASQFAHGEMYDSRTRKPTPIELTYKDTTGYFAICFNKPSFWVLRAAVESKAPWIGFNVKADAASLIPQGLQRLPPHPFAEFRVGISKVDDINALSRLLIAAFQKTVDDRKKESETAPKEGTQT